MSFPGLSNTKMAATRTTLPHFAPFLIVAAAGVWLAACSGVTERVSTPVAGNPGSPSGVATTGAAPTGATTLTGGESSGGSSPAAATSVKPRTLTVSDQGQGGITVKGTWVVLGSPEASSSQLDRYLAVKVALDTHSGDLTKFDLTKLSVLRNDQDKDTFPAAWQSISNDSHHREGILQFPRGAEQGSKYLELVVRDVGGVKERVLRWDLQG